MDDLLARLVQRHDDTWPIGIAEGEPINRDGEEAARRIAKIKELVVSENATIKRLEHTLNAVEHRVKEVREALRTHRERVAAAFGGD